MQRRVALIPLSRPKQHFIPIGPKQKDPIAAQDLAYRQAAEYWSGDEHLVIFREPNGTFCNQYGFISGRVTPTTGSFATLEEAEKQLYADRPLAQKVQAREKPPAHAPVDRDEAERRYQVVVYHHLETAWMRKRNTRRWRRQNR